MNLKLGNLGSYYTFLCSIIAKYLLILGTEACGVHSKLHQCWFLTPIFLNFIFMPTLICRSMYICSIS